MFWVNHNDLSSHIPQFSDLEAKNEERRFFLQGKSAYMVVTSSQV